MRLPNRRRLAVAALLLTVFVGALTNNVVAVPLEEISRSLGVDVSTGALVATVSTLGLAVFMPLAGWAADRFGRRLVLMLCLCSLLLSVAGAALASSFGMLLVCRLMQGVSLAAVPPTVMRMLPDLFQANSRGKALGLWAAANGMGQAVAPPLGGIVADAFGWRAIFWMIVPLILIALSLMCVVPRAEPQGGRFDIWGAAALSVGIAGVLGLLTSQSDASVRSGALTAAFAIAGFGALAVFWRHVNAVEVPFISPDLLRSSRFVWSSAAGFVQMFCLTVALLATPVHLLAEPGRSMSEVGLLLLTVTAAMAGLGPLAGGLAGRHGCRRVIRWGLVLLCIALGTLAVGSFQGVRSLALFGLALFLLGVGVAFVQSPAAVGASSAIRGRSGSSLGLFNTIRFSGAASGGAMTSVLLGTGLGIAGLFVLAIVVAIAAFALTFLRSGTDPLPG